jgi:hypothetical protein
MFSFICCRNPHQDDFDTEPATLRTLQLPSAVPVALPTSSVPHNARTRNDVSEAESHHEIFSPSSSARGCQAAAPLRQTAPGRSSFDADFKVGRRHTEKNSGSSEQLGHNLRQKLSQSQMSKSSSKVNIGHDEPGFIHLTSASGKEPDEPVLLLGTSHQSTGLAGLLVSRTASEGGYDSDAASIETAMLQSRVSPGFARQALQNEDFERKDTVMLNEAPRPLVETEQMGSEASDLSQSHSSPCLRTSPKTVFSSAQRLKGNQSSSGILRRIGSGFTNVTTKLPDTPELRAMSMPNILEANSDLRLSFSAPRCASNLKTLHDRMEKAKRASVATNDTSERPTKLVLDLDPTFVSYLSKKVRGTLPIHTNGEVFEYIDTGVCNSIISSQQRSVTSTNIQPLLDSDRESLHPVNMRISQRLTSNSLMPVLSPRNLNVGSVISKGVASDQHYSSRDGLSFISQEHNRRPSDPQTRRLFENGTWNGNLCPKRNAVTFLSSSYSNGKTAQRVHDDANLRYVSDADLTTIRPRILGNVVRRGSIKSPYSLAIGGRSGSGGLPKRRGSIGQLSNAEAAAWLKRNEANNRRGSNDLNILDRDGRGQGRGRSTSMPNGGRFIESVATPTKKSYHSTDANELTSKVSVDEANDQRNRTLSGLNAGPVSDKRNENLSKIDPILLHDDPSNGRASQRATAGWLTEGRRSDYVFDFVDDKTLGKCGGDEKLGEIGEVDERAPFQESVTNMSECALKGTESDALSGMGATDRRLLDHLGRRRSKTTSSASLNRYRQDRDSWKSVDRLDVADTRRSRSENGEEYSSLTQHQRLCSLGRTQPWKSESNLAGQLKMKGGLIAANEIGEDKMRKGSLLDIRRFTTIGILTGKVKDKYGRATPIKDLLSTWTRFPGHIREERNGIAGQNDGVQVIDFMAPALGNDPKTTKPRMSLYGTSQGIQSTADLGLYAPCSSRLLGLEKSGKRKSRSLVIKDGKIDSGGIVKMPTGSMQTFKGLYPSSPSELRQHVSRHDHWSSLSMTDSVEFAELEIIPGEGLTNVMWRRDQDNSERKYCNHSNDADGGLKTQILRPFTLRSHEGHARNSKDWPTSTSHEEGGDAERAGKAGGKLTASSSSRYCHPLLEMQCSGPRKPETKRKSTERAVQELRGQRLGQEDGNGSSVKQCAEWPIQRRLESVDLRASMVDSGNQLKDKMTGTRKEVLKREGLFGAGESMEGHEADSKIPSKIQDCELGMK